MAINGIETLIYGVEDVAKCTQFFEDFGLPLVAKSAERAHFQLEEGSNVIVRSLRDVADPKSSLAGPGVVETIWGVDSKASLDALAADLGRDREVRRDADGTVHFLTDDGLRMGLRIFEKVAVVTLPDPVNAPGHVTRLNKPRKWRLRARPKTIQHVVYFSPDPQRSFDFMRDRLNFRLTDTQRGTGIYARADGTRNHHNIFFLNALNPAFGGDGKLRFHHVNYGVEDIDEIMAGVNHMARQGWTMSEFGLGRHRIDSALFYYFPCPTGGEAEYGADGDMVNDDWIPRDWVEPLFGYITFVHNLPPFLKEPPPWEVKYLEGRTPPPRKQGAH